MMNMQKMMKQAQDLQKNMKVAQADIEATTFYGTSAQDLVKVAFTGDRKMTNIDIASDLIDPEDPETLSDMIAQAVNSALVDIDKTTEQKLGKFTKGLPF
ncbi:YbaB/EbfC family nucleoid-associated protein [Lactococcus piscium]|jgi:DNA-binding YbaB/EbfC family protein|uniref:Nucleoid-associated protein LACPI_0410 n=1 Tax=Pseudolactococcus piscium MKFS47 TaxID=297352 RepID=A0A0D6DVU9_9LACT|nr:YbaB/EbfC family nucleoid-associated protein [Lactococcus piscium]CEN27610.1 DNA-binding protein YbcG [Lactococcus piscium MKFS47]